MKQVILILLASLAAQSVFASQVIDRPIDPQKDSSPFNTENEKQYRNGLSIDEMKSLLGGNPILTSESNDSDGVFDVYDWINGRNTAEIQFSNGLSVGYSFVTYQK